MLRWLFEGYVSYVVNEVHCVFDTPSFTGNITYDSGESALRDPQL